MEKHNNNNMNMRYFIFAIYILFPVTVSAQAEKNYIRQGNREYNKGRYEESEVSYRKANEQNNRLPEIFFNIGDALYKQEKYDEAAKQFSTNAAMNEDVSKKAAGLYNLGNSYLKSGKFKESIEAYKESLRLQPNNHEAKYNLAYAQDLLKEQEKQQNQNDTPEDEEIRKIVEEAKKLVAQRRYQEAYNLIKESERKYPKLLQYADFTNRIMDIINMN